MLTLTLTTTGIEAESEARRIHGNALVYDEEAVVSSGQKVRFLPGSVDLSSVPVVMHHDESKPVGLVTKGSDVGDAHVVDIRVSKTAAGDEALVLAEDGVVSGMSVGVDPIKSSEDGDTLVIAEAAPRHLALVVNPAFAGATVDSVAASAAPTEPEEAEAVDTQEQHESQQAPAEVAAAPRQPAVTAGMPSVGEWMMALDRRHKDPETFAAVESRIQAAVGHILYNPNTDAWAETPFVGEMIDLNAPGERPVAEAFGVRAAPSGVPSFLRPKINAHLADATGAAEKTDVTDDGLDAGNETVSMSFIKRAANVSIEAQAFSSPDVYSIVARDLVRAYLRGFETKALFGLESADYTGRTSIIAQATFVQSLYDAAADIYLNNFGQPDLFVMAPDVWAKIGGFADSDGRPIFPYAGQMNAPGSSAGVQQFGLNVLGLRPVVTRTLTAGTAYLAASDSYEVYESSRVNLGPVQDPTVLGTAWAIGGAVGTLDLGVTGRWQYTLV